MPASRRRTSRNPRPRHAAVSLDISSGQYRLHVQLLPAKHPGEREVVTTVQPRLAWAVPLTIRMTLPRHSEDLRDMLAAARGGYFMEWLTQHGYDEYGNGNGTWGQI